MKFYKTILVHLKHILYGKYKYAYILMPWGDMGCHGVISRTGLSGIQSSSLGETGMVTASVHLCSVALNVYSNNNYTCQLPSCLSSGWLLTRSLSGIQSSSLTETGMVTAFTSAVLH